MMRVMTKLLLGVVVTLACLLHSSRAQPYPSGPFNYSFPDCTTGPLTGNVVCDTSKDAVTRAQAIVSLFTDEELTKNTVNKSPGVPRLGLPPYQWWSEALVSRSVVCLIISRAQLDLIAWGSLESWGRLQTGWQTVQFSNILSSAYTDGSSFRRRTHKRSCCDDQYRGSRIQQYCPCRSRLLHAKYQPLQGPTLGQRTGNAWRRPVSHFPICLQPHRGLARRYWSSAVLQGHCGL